MDPQLLIHIAAAFFVGGSLIAILSFIAEKASPKVAGVILSFPSTVLVGFFFMSWTLGPEKIPEAIPPIPLMSGSIFLMVIAYLHIARLPLPKGISVALTSTLSLGVWLLYSIPLAVFEFNRLGWSLIGYLFFLGIGYWFLTVKNPTKDEPIPVLKYTTFQKINRALFAGSMISVSVFFANVLGPLWGGVFSYFPATYLSTLVILHLHYGPDMLFRVFKKAPIGSIPIMGFVLASYFTYPTFGTMGGTTVAAGISLGLFVIIYRFSR